MTEVTHQDVQWKNKLKELLAFISLKYFSNGKNGNPRMSTIVNAAGTRRLRNKTA
jgi:hypothetical protein